MQSQQQPQKRVGLHIVVPAVLAVLSVATVSILLLEQMAREVTRIDREVRVGAAEAGVAALATRLRETHADYARWDEAYVALSGNLDEDFIQRNITLTTGLGNLYDFAMVLDDTGAEILALRNGLPLPAGTAEAMRAPLAALGREVSVEPDYVNAAGFLAAPFGTYVVAIGPVVPVSQPVPANQRTLVLGKALAEDAIARIGEETVLTGLRLLPPGDPEPNAVPIVDPLGTRIAALAWDQPDPGHVALAQVVPVTALTVALLALLIGYLVNSAFRGLKQAAHSERQARVSADRDALSGLANRRAFRDRLDQAVARAAGTLHSVAVAYVDLDGFKEVNDTQGHETGDRLICVVAASFQSITEGRGFLARVGGDEFALLFEGLDAAAEASQAARRILDHLSRPLALVGHVANVGASIGISVLDDHAMSGEELLRRADVAMYMAKETGRHRLAVYRRTMDADKRERAAIAADLRAALVAGRLEVVYQPIADAVTHRTIGAEALIRWSRPGFGEMAPDHFIPIAEASGLIGELGTYVLRKACADASHWKDVFVSVNVSPAQFRDGRFGTLVATIIAETGIDPRRLALEVTETYLINYPDEARRAIDGMRALGISVALDDFGTGYSSLGYLRQFTFDGLKLDRRMIEEMSESENGLRFVQATIAMASALRLSVTAEGVETQEQATTLRKSGCQRLQGYLFSQALSAAEMRRRHGDSGPIALSA
jgi:diguanylate cyclase (GGDEF)-like protein